MKPAPQLKSVGDWLKHIFFGICMGMADLVPGVSGGTIAFVLGFYEDLITSVKSISIFRPKQIAWSFLTALLTGVVISFVTFAKTIHGILGNEISRTYLYAAFFGLIVASIFFCLKHVKKWHFRYIVTLLLGAGVAFLLTASTSTSLETEWSNWWLILCGVVAVCAMLLPGVSGSYMLVIFGMYAVVIGALADFLEGLKTFTFLLEPFLLLANLGVGMLIGAIAFSRVISWLLDRHHQSTISMLIGFMVGALHVVWPFHPHELENGPQLWIVVGIAITAFLAVLILEAIATKKISPPRAQRSQREEEKK